MKSLLSFVMVILVGLVPALADGHDTIDTFDPSLTADFIVKTVARTDCTPICGNPVCCIAMQLRFAKYAGKGSVEELRDQVTTLAPDLSTFLAAADEDPSLYEKVGLAPIVDLDEFAEAEQVLMSAVQPSIGVDMECSTCCFNCGGKVCCGGCWTF